MKEMKLYCISDDETLSGALAASECLLVQSIGGQRHRASISSREIGTRSHVRRFWGHSEGYGDRFMLSTREKIILEVEIEGRLRGLSFFL